MRVNGDMCKKSWASTRIVPSVLTGVFPEESLSKMNENRLERVVTRLVDSTTGGIAHIESENNSDCGKCVRPKWWPDNLVFEYPLAELRTRAESYSMKWRAMLKYLITACTDFYRSDYCARTLSSARCRTYLPRKVLAPTQPNENVNGPMMKRKRNSSDDIGYDCNVKRSKLLNNNVKLCSVVLKKKPVENFIIENKCLSRNAIVPLRDVFQEIPDKKQQTEDVTKDNFLQYFGLGESGTKPETRVAPVKLNFVRLCTVPNIPFSSDLGKLIMKRENQSISDEVHLRRIDRTEWYLKGSQSNSFNDRNYEVMFEDKCCNRYRHYEFPKRQLTQKHRGLQEAFLDYLIKPAYVCVEKLDDNLLSRYRTNATFNYADQNKVRRCSLRLKNSQEKNS